MSNSILYLHNCLNIALQILRAFPELATTSVDPLLQQLYKVMQSEVMEPSSTTEKQYIIYLRALCHTIYYTSLIMKQLNRWSETITNAMANCILKILVLYPKHLVGADDNEAQSI